jgi:hypothetical protein
MIRRNLLKGAFVATAVAVLAACGGGGGGGGVLPSAPATATPQAVTSASVTYAFPTSGGPFSEQLPAYHEYLGTLLLPIVTSPAGTKETITVSTTLPSGAPQLQSVRRGAMSYDNAAIEYVTLTYGNAVHMNALPSFQFSLPSTISTTAEHFYVAFYDPGDPAAGWQDAAIGPAHASGQVLSFGSPNPPAYGARQFTFLANKNYLFALYNENASFTDDWTSFQHDQQLTGYERNATGITPQNVAQLQLAWRVQPDQSCAVAGSAAQQNTVDASPLVWNGLVYYTDQCGLTVALHREDGAIAWREDESAYAPYVKATLGGARGTPAIDPARDIIVIPIWGLYPAFGTCPGSTCVPAHGSYLLALNAQTGAVLWRAYPPNTNSNTHSGSAVAGNLRGSPIVLNGTVFMGLAGGDEDGGSTQGGVEGGVFAVNETTGQRQPGYFQVAPLGEANDAGSSWSPISTDGQYIYFGTGNTIHGDGMQDSVIRLNPQDMSATPAFKLQTSPVADDSDVGGGTMLWGGNAYFTAKNGYYYSSSLLTPAFTIRTQTNSNRDNGSYATPSTDGTVIAVPSGFVYGANGLARSTLEIFPVGGGKTICSPTTIQSTNTGTYNSPAFVQGLGFIGIDNNAPTGDVAGSAPAFVAFNDKCQIVWHANLGSGPVGYFVGGPAVVESGVYAIDANGNVYSWKLPQMIGIQSHGRTNIQSAVGTVGPHHQSFELLKARHRGANL